RSSHFRFAKAVPQISHLTSNDSVVHSIPQWVVMQRESTCWCCGRCTRTQVGNDSIQPLTCKAVQVVRCNYLVFETSCPVGGPLQLPFLRVALGIQHSQMLEVPATGPRLNREVRMHHLLTARPRQNGLLVMLKSQSALVARS